MEAEDHIRRSREAAAGVVSVVLQKIGTFYGQIQKLDDAIFDKTADDLVDSQILDVVQYHEKVVSTTASLRLKLQECRSSLQRSSLLHRGSDSE